MGIILECCHNCKEVCTFCIYCCLYHRYMTECRYVESQIEIELGTDRSKIF